MSTHLTQAGTGRRLSVPDAVVTVLSSGEHTGGAYEVMLVEAPCGTPPPLHSEPWPKTYHLLRGRILALLDGYGCELAAGDTLTIEAGTSNTFSVLTDDAAFLLVCPGTGMRGFFTDLHALGEAHLPEEVLTSTLAQIAARYDIRFAEEAAT
ncbi:MULTISPECIES: cupin domain-containing protein [Rhodococcus]|uniref:cupin domain-containing protein n=1 Tax=Rhodococcus TaxID=1827 RepID=UPI0007CD424B|nr:cupin domain-containing protein [Rhodococcus gordoniae]